jgi:lipoprotein-anchoring transpeptidase ErfK/SrfK
MLINKGALRVVVEKRWRDDQFMPRMNRRAVIKGVSAIGAASGLASCASRSTYIDPMYLRQSVQYDARQAPGTIVVDPSNHFLYHVQEGARAVRYGVGVGGEGFGWSGVATVHDKQEWPWLPFPAWQTPARPLCNRHAEARPELGILAQ